MVLLIMLYKVVLTFTSLVCDYSNESYGAEITFIILGHPKTMSVSRLSISI